MKKLTHLYLGILCILSILGTSCTKVVTQEMLTPKSTELVTLPKLYPVMMERQDFKDTFKPTKDLHYASLADTYYSDMKDMFFDNQVMNFKTLHDDQFGYIRLNSLDVKFKGNAWYLIPSICTVMWANIFGCPFSGVKVKTTATFSIIDCEGNEIKRYEIKESGKSTSSLYNIGTDIIRIAHIKACKNILKTLNKNIQKDYGRISQALNQSAEGVMERQQMGIAAVKKENSYFDEGMSYFSNGNYEQAVATFTKALQSSPHHYMALFYRGISLLNMEQYSQALADFKETSLINPTIGEAYYFQSTIQQKFNQNEYALMNICRAIDVQPDQEEYYFTYATLLLTSGNLEESKTQFKKLLEINPNRLEIYDTISQIDAAIQDKKNTEDAQYIQMVTQQAQAMQAVSQSIANNMTAISNTIAAPSSTSGSVNIGGSGGSREQIQAQIEKAYDQLEDMERNRILAASSPVTEMQYNKMIIKQKELIRQLKAKLRNAQ